MTLLYLVVTPLSSRKGAFEGIDKREKVFVTFKQRGGEFLNKKVHTVSGKENRSSF